MDLVAYSQYYRPRTPERQLEINECLRRNLNNPVISRMVLFCESDAPPMPEGMLHAEAAKQTKLSFPYKQGYSIELAKELTNEGDLQGITQSNDRSPHTPPPRIIERKSTSIITLEN